MLGSAVEVRIAEQPKVEPGVIDFGDQTVDAEEHLVLGSGQFAQAEIRMLEGYPTLVEKAE